MDIVTKRFMDKGYTVEITYPKTGRLFTLVSSNIDDDRRIRCFDFVELDGNAIKRLKKAYDSDVSKIDTDVFLIAEHFDRCYFKPFHVLLTQCRNGYRPSVLWGKAFFFAISHLLKTT